MRVDIKEVLSGIIADASNSEEILKRVKEQFPNSTVSMTEINVKDEDAHKDCDCIPCKIKKIMQDDSFWKSEECKTSRRYKLADEELSKRLGNDVAEWIDFLVTLKGFEAKTIKQIVAELVEFDLAKLSQRVCFDNIERLMSKKEA